MIELFIGGCRSGKSAAALKRSDQVETDRKVFVATCQPLDDEMRTRVERHQQERGNDWETIEEPIDVAGIVQRINQPRTVLLVDCLTLWLTNMILTDQDDASIDQQIGRLENTLIEAQGTILLVSNEVGLGIVPDNAMGRRFRDWAGTLNQRMAACAHSVTLTVAGIPVPIKTTPPKDGSLRP